MRLVLSFAALFCVVAGSVSAGSASAVSSCGRAGYSYAGFQATGPAHGVRADLVALGRPYVQSGHVAAWVGVGGPGQGAGGSDAWIQVGLSAFEGTGSRLYFEVNKPGVGPRYREVRASVAPGSRHRIAVLEVSRRPGWWRVWVDGRPVSKPVYLPGSSGRWRPIATAETWDGGRRVCNRFVYRFDGLSVAGSRGGSWRRFVSGHRFLDPGYRIVNQRHGFLARAVQPLPRASEAAAKEPAASAQDANGGPGTDVPLQDQHGPVGDSDTAVGDGLPEELGGTRPMDADDPAAGPFAE